MSPNDDTLLTDSATAEVTPAPAAAPDDNLVPDDQLPADAADGVSPDEQSVRSDELPPAAQ